MPNQPKTPARTYRFEQGLLDLLDQLGQRLGGLDRTAVLRLAVRRLADTELGPETASKKSRKKRQGVLTPDIHHDTMRV